VISTSSCSLNNKYVGNVFQSFLNLDNQGIKEIRDDADNTSAKDSEKQPIYEPAFNPVELEANAQNSLLEWIRHENIPAWVRNTFFK